MSHNAAAMTANGRRLPPSPMSSPSATASLAFVPAVAITAPTATTIGVDSRFINTGPRSACTQRPARDSVRRRTRPRPGHAIVNDHDDRRSLSHRHLSSFLSSTASSSAFLLSLGRGTTSSTRRPGFISMSADNDTTTPPPSSEQPPPNSHQQHTDSTPTQPNTNTKNTSSTTTSPVRYKDDGSRVVPVPLFIHGTSNESVRGVYAVLDDTRAATYIGMSRDIAASLEAHAARHGDDVCYVRVMTFTDDDDSNDGDNDDDVRVKQMKRVVDVWLLDNEVTPIGNAEQWYEVDEELHKRASALSPIDDIDDFDTAIKDTIVSPFAAATTGAGANNSSNTNDNTHISSQVKLDLDLTLENVAMVIDDQIRPALQSHSGDITILRVDDASQTVEVKLLGACVSCSAATTTMHMGVEKTLRAAFGDHVSVVAVDDDKKDGTTLNNSTGSAYDDDEDFSGYAQYDDGDVSIDMCEVALDSIRDVLHGLGAHATVVEVDEDEVIVSYKGPHSLKFGIEQTLRDKVHGVTVVTFE